jgi:2'-hydroxyisoflavone reductase
MTRLLVLGGSAFVGRAIVDDALARGWDVTTFNRGVTAAAYTRGNADTAVGGNADTAVGGNADTAVGVDADTAVGADAGGAPARPGEGRVTRLIGDRTDVTALSQLTASSWDLVADTWSGVPAVVRDSARLLADRAGRYIYISSGSVYAPPPPVGAREDAPTIDVSPNDADADADASDYARCKRGAELVVLDAFGPERALIARPGLIIGPHEDVGRLPWWLERVSRGGEVLAPGPPERPLQLIDARDLARFVLDAATSGHAGVFNTVSRRGHATTQTLLDSCMDVAGAPDARLTWVAADVIERAGIEPWTQLPIWLPLGHEYEGLHGADVERGHAAGLRCRPVAETVADTWAWMWSRDGPPPRKPGLPAPGVDPSAERAALALAHAGG